MAHNDQLLLDKIVEGQRATRSPTTSTSDFFEQYVAEQVLKDFDLSDEEIESGLTGGGHDGGIDAIYTLANGELVQEDFDFKALKKNVVIEVFVIQSKTSNGFDEETINKLNASTSHLFSLEQSLEALSSVYNEGVRDGVRRFRGLYQSLADKFPAVRFNYVYASRGDSAQVHPNVSKKVEDLEKSVRTLFPHAEFTFVFLGSTDLLGLARKQPATTFEIRFTELLTGNKGYIALVLLKDFILFIRGQDGLLRRSLFEANVRDYQGSILVNGEIKESLVAGGPEDFWWLNNGVTVVAGKAVQAGKVLTLEDPQIVNGQQTSTEIFNYFQEANTDDDERSVMVRVIVPEELGSYDRIIKATNSQTSINAATLRATEKIHRDIEEFLAPYSIFYDRRKNSQRQQGRPTDKIISIGLLAQGMMSVLLQRPDDARARPSSLINRGDDYNQIFSHSHPIGVYLVAAKLVKGAQAYLRGRIDLQRKDRNNLLFYVAMHAASVLTSVAEPNATRLAAVDVGSISDDLFSASLAVVEPIYKSLGASDQAAKGPALLSELKKQLKEQFPPSGQSQLLF